MAGSAPALRAVGTVRFAAHRRARCSRGRRDAVRHRRLGHVGPVGRLGPTGYSEDPTLDAKVWEGLHIASVFERADEFDLIHNSFDFLPLTYSGLVDTPVVTTIHGFSSERIVPVFEQYNDRGYYVAISDADRHDRLDYVATIHHGIDMRSFSVRDEPGDYLLFFGRIHPDKGTVEAIDVAEKAGLPLKIAGIVQDRGLLRSVRRATRWTASRFPMSARSAPTSAGNCSAAPGPSST